MCGKQWQMIRVFPRRTHATPDDKDAWFGPPPLWRLEGDVSVSCTFTYDMQHAERLADAWAFAGYNVSLGGPAYDDRGGAFVPGQYIKRGYVFTSRGCNNRCWFCKVPMREGPIRELDIADGWNVLDSNLLQCSEGHIRAVFAMLARQPEQAVFTGGLEAAILKDWHIHLLSELKPKRIYFAYDTPGDLEPLVEAQHMLVRAGLIGPTKHICSCYVLIGYPGDTFDAAEKRLNTVLDLGYTPMAMLYRDDAESTSKTWRRFQRTWVRPMIIYSRKAH